MWLLSTSRTNLFTGSLSRTLVGPVTALKSFTTAPVTMGSRGNNRECLAWNWLGQFLPHSNEIQSCFIMTQSIHLTMSALQLVHLLHSDLWCLKYNTPLGQNDRDHSRYYGTTPTICWIFVAFLQRLWFKISCAKSMKFLEDTYSLHSLNFIRVQRIISHRIVTSTTTVW